MLGAGASMWEHRTWRIGAGGAVGADRAKWADRAAFAVAGERALKQLGRDVVARERMGARVVPVMSFLHGGPHCLSSLPTRERVKDTPSN